MKKINKEMFGRLRLRGLVPYDNSDFETEELKNIAVEMNRLYNRLEELDKSLEIDWGKIDEK